MTQPPSSLSERRRAREGTRVPPHSLEAEESLLGAMFLSRDAAATAVEQLVAEDFYKPSHGEIFGAMSDLFGRGEPVDPVTVAEQLRHVGQLDTIGGRVALTDLQMATPATSSAGRYARIVAEHALMRRLIVTAAEITELGYHPTGDVAETVDAAERLLYDVRRANEIPEARSLGAGLEEWLDRTEARSASGGAPEHPMGWIELDEITGGLHPSHLTVVAARPGMGKTSWAGNMAANVAAAGDAVLFVSVEMSYEELVGRFVAHAARLDGSRLARGQVSPNDWKRISQAIGGLVPLPVDIVDIATATLMSVRAAARRAVSRHRRLGVIIVDYVQLMTVRERAENRQVAVAELARGLKLLAKELAVPVVALAQLNRSVEMRRDKRPMLADLRESGDLENSADTVVFIYRDEYYKPRSEDRGIAELIVAKNRHGPQGTARLAVDLTSGRWSDLAREES